MAHASESSASNEEGRIRIDGEAGIQLAGLLQQHFPDKDRMILQIQRESSPVGLVVYITLGEPGRQCPTCNGSGAIPSDEGESQDDG